MWDSTGNALPVNRVKHLCSVTVMEVQESSTCEKDRIRELEDLVEKVSINPTLLTSCMYNMLAGCLIIFFNDAFQL